MGYIQRMILKLNDIDSNFKVYFAETCKCCMFHPSIIIDFTWQIWFRKILFFMLYLQPKILSTECSHSLQAYNFGTSFFQGLFLSFPILILSSSFSRSLSLTVSLFLSPTHSPIYLSLSYSLHLSLSNSSFSFSPLLSPFSFFPFKTIQPL